MRKVQFREGVESEAKAHRCLSKIVQIENEMKEYRDRMANALRVYGDRRKDLAGIIASHIKANHGVELDPDEVIRRLDREDFSIEVEEEGQA